MASGELEERHDGLDTRVVDEDVDGAELAPDAIDHRFDIRSPRDVGLYDKGVPAGRPERPRNLLGLIQVAHIVYCHVRTFRGEHFRKASPDAARRAGHECDFALQLQGILPSKPRRDQSTGCKESRRQNLQIVHMVA